MTDSIFGETIFSYSRQDALNDGVLVDVTKLASEAGFTIPVAVNDGAMSMIVPTPEVAAKFGCDKDGRLWDVVFMAMVKVRSLIARAKAAGDNRPIGEVMFNLILPQTTNDDTEEKATCQLKLVIHAGDNGEPVITIMRPGDD